MLTFAPLDGGGRHLFVFRQDGGCNTFTRGRPHLWFLEHGLFAFVTFVLSHLQLSIVPVVGMKARSSSLACHARARARGWL